MTNEVLSKKNFKSVAWKNGLGFTSEIAIEPRDADFSRGEFLWRISRAQIAAAAKFSMFPEYDRKLVILTGAGIHLRSQGRVQELRPLRPFSFSGAEDVACELIEGAVSDLNIFTRRDRCRAEVEVRGGHQIQWHALGRWNFAMALKAEFTVDDASQTQLQDGDVLSMENLGGESRVVEFRSVVDGRLILISIYTI